MRGQRTGRFAALLKKLAHVYEREGLLMNLVVWTISIFLASVVHSFAMENIEADAAYDREIKEQIRQEFTQGLKLLKAQADGLGMEVREKDFLTLQQHMYNKAILMGRCVDKAITLKKKGSDKILLDKYVKVCVETHLKFMSSSHESSPKCLFQARKLGFGTNNDSMSINPPYDFLGIKDQMPSATDYVTMKDCYDNRTATDKLLDK
jgi:hypothetical protein